MRLRLIAATAPALLLASSAFAGQQLQGQQLQGQQLQGQQLQGQQLQGTSTTGAATPSGTASTETPLNHLYAGWYLGSRPLGPARVDRGALVISGNGNGNTFSGQELVGAFVPAERNGNRVWTQITAVTQDPTYPDGSTLLYSIEVYAADGTHAPLCAPDANGVSAAIPLAAVFDSFGNRVESTSEFTFGCTAGVIAKCYRWGYRPWLTGITAPDYFARLHWTCTRMARADYCGNGQTWTYNGTLINIWDLAPAPGPFQSEGTPPPDFLFEAGWSTHGAVCLSKQRWATLPPSVAQSCPDRLIPPGATSTAGTVCNSQTEALTFDSTTQLFNESKLNVQ